MPFDSRPRNLRGCKIRDDHDFTADELLRIVGFRDAGNDLANFGAYVDFNPQQLVGALYLFGKLHFADAQLDLEEVVDRDLVVGSSRGRRGWGTHCAAHPAGEPGSAAPPSAFCAGEDASAGAVPVTSSAFVSVVFVSLSVERSCSIFCILSIMLLSARGKTGSTLPSLVPICSCPHFNSVQRKLADIAQTQLPPDAFSRFRNDGMRQRSHDAQRLGRGVQNRCQLRARVRVFLFGQRPRVGLRDVAIDRRR